MKTKLDYVWQWLRSGFWFLPSLMALVAIALAFLVVYVDSSGNGHPLGGLGFLFDAGPDGAREVLSAIAASTITVTSVIFSITVVVLALASQQFGPRLLRTFLRDMSNQAVIGMFVATYIYTLLVLRTIGSTSEHRFVPHLGVTVAVVLALISMAVLIYYVHHVATSIQATSIINAVRQDLETAIDKTCTEPGASLEGGMEGPPDRPFQEKEGMQVVISRTGYIQALDIDGLLQLTQRNGLVVRMLFRPGDFVNDGDVVAEYHPASHPDQDVLAAVRETVVIDSAPTQTQDLLFTVDQLVQIAVRALSPGINDPLTAMQCLEALGAGIIRLSERELPPVERCAADGHVRLILRGVTFDEVVDASFAMIRHYGKSSPSVLIQMLRTLARAAGRVRTEGQREALRREIEHTHAVAGEDLEFPHDRERLEEEYSAAIRKLEQQA